MNKKFLSLLLLAIPMLSFAQEKGLDEQVNDAFMPLQLGGKLSFNYSANCWL